MSDAKKTSRKEYLKSALVIAVIVVVVLGFFFGLRFALGTDVPVRVVESGSMCVPYDGACDGWSHTFDQTLHVGDIIIIQAVDPKDININYPNSDIIVYQNPNNPDATPIVHRVVTSYTGSDGTLYFQTKGDGNPSVKWPNTPSPDDYDSNTLWHTGQGVPQSNVIGKVVMRIPWFGHITLFLRGNPWGLPVVIALIMVLLLVEFILPYAKKKSQQQVQETKNENIGPNFTIASY
jgi:signal peptidase I